MDEVTGQRAPSVSGHREYQQRLRARLFSAGAAAGAALGLVYFVLGARVAAGCAAAVAAVLLGGHALLRHTGHGDAVVHGALGSTAALLWLMALFEPVLDPVVLAWLGVLPFGAVLTLSSRAALGWLVVTCGLVVAAAPVHRLGLVPTLEAPVSPIVTVLRAVALIATYFTFARRFEAERSRTVAGYETAARARSIFLANVSHEIRTPMNGVLGLTELLRDDVQTPAAREHVAMLHRSAQAMVLLINELLDMSRIEAGKFSLEVADFDFTRLLDDLERLHQPLAGQRGLTLRLEVAPGVPRCLRGDELRLRQVLTNLLSNGLKFTAAGAVTLRVTPAGQLPGGLQRLRFEVADTGAGIAPEVLARLFRPFEQGDASTTRRHGGSGLGLALSRELVRLMGGELVVDTTPGVGSRFAFELSLPEGVPALALSTPSRPRAAPAPHALPVLVVDDNPINLKVACALVERLGYRTVTAIDGQQALDAVQQQPFAAVLMDCHMPVMDGFESTERIRALDGPSALVPVVAVTASAMPEEVARCYQAGMNECLAKPVTLQQLDELLQKVEHYRAVLNGAA